MSSKMQFQVFYGDYNILYGPNGVDLSAFKRTSSGIDKPLERSFGSICKWLQRGFHVDPLIHVITVQSLVNWEVDSELWELMMIHSTDDWQKYMQAALERGWPLAILVQIREKTQNEIQHCADQGVACRALMIGSPRCSRGWTNGNRQTSTWSIQQDHTQTAPLGLTSPGTYPGLGLIWFMLTLTRSHTRRGLRMAMPGTMWRH